MGPPAKPWWLQCSPVQAVGGTALCLSACSEYCIDWAARPLSQSEPLHRLASETPVPLPSPARRRHPMESQRLAGTRSNTCCSSSIVQRQPWPRREPPALPGNPLTACVVSSARWDRFHSLSARSSTTAAAVERLHSPLARAPVVAARAPGARTSLAPSALEVCGCDAAPCHRPGAERPPAATAAARPPPPPPSLLHRPAYACLQDRAPPPSQLLLIT